MSLPKTLLRRGLQTVGIVVVAVFLLVLVLSIFRVSIPLGFLEPRVTAAATSALGREFTMKKAPRVVIGWKPALEIEACSIGNPSSWPSSEPVARLDRFYMRLGLFPLLRKDLRIDDLEISGLHLNLESLDDGRNNWNLDTVVGPAEERADKPAATGSEGGGYRFTELRRLSVEDVNLRSKNPDGEEKLKLAIESVKGRATAGHPMTLEIAGSLQERPFEGTFRGGTLGALVDDTKAWPYQFAAAFDDMSVFLSGDLGNRDRSVASENAFEIDIPDLAGLEEFTGRLPRFGAVRLTGTMRFTADGFALPTLTGKLGDSILNGDLTVDTTGALPRVDGRLAVGILDLAVFPGRESDKANESEEAESATGTTGPEAEGKERETLLPCVGEVRLTVAEIVTPKAKVQHLDLGVQLEEGALTADVSVKFAEAPLRGELAIRKHDREENPTTLNLDLLARRADIGELVAFYSGSRKFKGPFESLRYTIDGAGETLGEAWTRKHVELEVIDADVIYESAEEVTEFRLDRGFIDSAWNRESRMGADGFFQGEKFSLTYHRLPIAKAKRSGRAPFLELNGTAAGASFKMAGETRVAETDPPIPLDLEVSGNSLGGFHNWLGIPKAATIPYAIRGTIRMEDGWHLSIREGNLGGTEWSGEVASTSTGENGPSSLLARLSVGSIDFEEFGPLFGRGPDGSDPDDDGFTLDSPILPARLPINNTDIDLTVDKLVFEKGEISDVTLTASARDGWIADAPFRFTFDGTVFSGAAAVDFRKEQPEAGFQFTTEHVDLGNVLDVAGLAENLDFKAGKLDLSVHARGETLREILLESDLAVSFSEARWIIRDINTGAELPVVIDTGTVWGKRGEDIEITFDGSVSETPLRIVARTDGVDAILAEEKQMNLSVEAEVSGSRIEWKGRSLLPLDRVDLDAELTWTGEKLSDLNELLNVDLPPVGPVSLTGRIRVVDEGYSLSDLDFKVGETDLTGKLSLNTTGKRPALEVDLETGRFQIDDFAAEGWSPVRGTKDDRGLVAQLREADEQLVELLSAEVLGSLDASIRLNASDVRSGKDKLGKGSAAISLKDGRLEIAPLLVEIPGGNFSARWFFHPRTKDYDFGLTLKADRFDYGVLARRKDPQTDVKGFLNVDVAIRTMGTPLEESPFARANGRVNFEVCPEKMRAGIFDFWGANILFAILPAIDPERRSKVNCILGIMNLEDGIMKPEVLGIDTTRVRVISEGSANFKDETIDLLLVPRPKRPEFLRAGTKIMVRGTFADPQIDTGPLPILRSLARMTGSTILFPGNLLFQERIPEDGSDICSCAGQPKESGD